MRHWISGPKLAGPKAMRARTSISNGLVGAVSGIVSNGKRCILSIFNSNTEFTGSVNDPMERLVHLFHSSAYCVWIWAKKTFAVEMDDVIRVFSDPDFRFP